MQIKLAISLSRGRLPPRQSVLALPCIQAQAGRDSHVSPLMLVYRKAQAKPNRSNADLLLNASDSRHYIVLPESTTYLLPLSASCLGQYSPPCVPFSKANQLVMITGSAYMDMSIDP